MNKILSESSVADRVGSPMGCLCRKQCHTHQRLSVSLVQVVYLCIALLQQLAQVALVCCQGLNLQ